MPYLSKPNKVYKIRNAEGKFLNNSTFKWNDKGIVWKSLEGARCTYRWLKSTTTYSYEKLVIVEFTLTETNIFDGEKKITVLKDFDLNLEEKLENI